LRHLADRTLAVECENDKRAVCLRIGSLEELADVACGELYGGERSVLKVLDG
jgi:hypothetical protein